MYTVTSEDGSNITIDKEANQVSDKRNIWIHQSTTHESTVWKDHVTDKIVLYFWNRWHCEKLSDKTDYIQTGEYEVKP